MLNDRYNTFFKIILSYLILHYFSFLLRQHWQEKNQKQKQPSEVFIENAALKNFGIFTEKHLCWSLFLIKMQACNFIKRRLQHGCFPVNIAKFLRTPILKNIYGKAIVKMVRNYSYNSISCHVQKLLNK